jgi:putative transposase
MKRSKFSEQQIAFILRQAEEGTSVEEVCRKAGVTCPFNRTDGRHN